MGGKSGAPVAAAAAADQATQLLLISLQHSAQTYQQLLLGGGLIDVHMRQNLRVWEPPVSEEAVSLGSGLGDSVIQKILIEVSRT